MTVACLASDGQTREYETKAAYMANFLEFVTWPLDAITNDDAPFRIGVFGGNPFGPALQSIVRAEVVNHHKVTVERCLSVEECVDCQMVFVCHAQQEKLALIVKEAGSRPVLIVGESRGFARRGGCINFYFEGSRLRFEINPSAAKRCNLKMSAQLLNLGRIVHSEGGVK